MHQSVRNAQLRAQQAWEEAREAKAAIESGFKALAKQLDALKPGLEKAVIDAMDKARDEQIKITAAEVAAELEAETKLTVKED